MSIEDLMEEDSKNISFTDEDIHQLSNLAQQQVFLEQQVKSAEESLAALKDDLRKIQTIAIPDLMLAFGMEKFTLSNGASIEVKDDVTCSIKATNIEDAVEFLNSIGVGDVVKNETKVSFGKGENEKALELMNYLASNQHKFSSKKSVHPSTLKAMVKEQQKKGVEFPEEFFSIFPLRKTKIKLPK